MLLICTEKVWHFSIEFWKFKYLEKYCAVCKCDCWILYNVLILICCFVMIGVNGHIPGGKEGQHLAVFGIDVTHWC